MKDLPSAAEGRDSQPQRGKGPPTGYLAAWSFEVWPRAMRGHRRTELEQEKSRTASSGTRTARGEARNGGLLNALGLGAGVEVMEVEFKASWLWQFAPLGARPFPLPTTEISSLPRSLSLRRRRVLATFSPVAASYSRQHQQCRLPNRTATTPMLPNSTTRNAVLKRAARQTKLLLLIKALS